MIQRIQSIYLTLAIVAFALVAFKVPIWTMNEQLFMAQDDTKMFILTIVGLLVTVLGLFLFKKRKLQMKFIRLAVLVEMVIAVRLFMVYKEFEVSLNANCLIALAIAFVALILAYRGVKKDDDLVRSVDRIR